MFSCIDGGLICGPLIWLVLTLAGWLGLKVCKKKCACKCHKKSP